MLQAHAKIPKPRQRPEKKAYPITKKPGDYVGLGPERRWRAGATPDNTSSNEGESADSRRAEESQLEPTQVIDAMEEEQRPNIIYNEEEGSSFT